MSQQAEHYVYVLFRANGIPFYVGMGKGSRWMQHEKTAKTGKTHKDKVVRLMVSLGQEIPKVKVVEGLTADQAFEVEKQLIKAIGRHPHGPLANGTDGGEGHTNPSAEARAKLSAVHQNRTYRSGFKMSDEAKAKVSKAKMGNSLSPDARARIAAKLRGSKLSDETKRKLSVAHTGMKFTPEHRANMSKAKMLQNLRPETLQKRSIALTGQKRTAEQKAKMRASRLAYLAKSPNSQGIIL